MSTKKNLKSKKNLTRFTYENSAFLGWRLSISRAGSTFSRYFSDKQYGGEKESLAMAEAALAAIKGVLDTAKRVEGKLVQSSVAKVEKILASS